MKKRKKSKKGLVILIAIIIVLIIILLILSKYIDKSNDETQELNNTNPIELSEDENTELLGMLQYERIYYYLNEYLSFIEEGKYELAYNCLYSEFKDTYYPTIEEYTKYVQKKYPVIISISDNGYNPVGEYWVLDIKFIDILNSTTDNEISFNQKFILKENSVNDFVLSFQAE